MAPSVRAPVCVFCRRQPVDPAWRPFCSKRCKMQDLAKWADGTYRIASTPLGDSEDTEHLDAETDE